MFEKSFPKSLLEDVKVVEKVINQSIKVTDHIIISYTLLNDEKIEFPDRIYCRDDSNISNLTKQQNIIYSCIYSRHHDGFIRQKHIERILSQDINFWTAPYIIKISDEYIIDILKFIYDNLKDKDHSVIKETAIKNIDIFLYNYSRMTSYWNEFYRSKYPKFSNYIGRTLFYEIFGYRKTLEKRRKKFEYKYGK